MTFNTQNTNNMNWFTEANLQTSPWQDIHEKVKNYFSLVGVCVVRGCRNFLINQRWHNNCPGDTGWLSIGTIFYCDWENIHGVLPFLYSKKKTVVNWNDSGEFTYYY
jgi:hypothetical protein